MGKRTVKRVSAAWTDSVSSTSKAMSDLSLVLEADEVPIRRPNSVDNLLNALFEKRGSAREKALSLIIEAFTNSLQHQFVEKKCVTLLYQCLNSIKRGSAKEISLACHAIGLLALTVGCGDNAHEILEESIHPLSQALKLGSESSKISSILDCLAIITFVGGNGPEEMESSMQIMWQVVHPKLGANVVASKPSAAVLTAAISAWSFLLTTMNGWRLNSRHWQESISYFSSLLDKDDQSVSIAAVEALALIFEIGSLEKFSCEAKGSNDSSDHEGNKSRERYACIQGLKEKILNQVRNLSVEAGNKGSAKKDLCSQRNLFQDVVEFLEDGYCPETSMKIGGESLKISTWSQLIQLNFLKRFLGGGFVKHMLENGFLHDVFEFTPKREHLPVNDHNTFNSEKVVINFYLPEVRKEACSQRMHKSPNSFLNKARTRLLNKQRVISQGRNNGHYTIGLDSKEEP
ncbi:hypothetical protein HHK36_008293 [Tetracentron sinense]|uniref:Interferon-related developmental regulator 1 n=1 Tax=Tetracentron sinense TaxID=13715 RepID=A0A834ZJ89_TETSI|nr:hypothetical protein HHK36_008293 [Tetracentron sinense]